VGRRGYLFSFECHLPPAAFAPASARLGKLSIRRNHTGKKIEQQLPLMRRERFNSASLRGEVLLTKL
jgi:hypothetical protein